MRMSTAALLVSTALGAAAVAAPAQDLQVASAWARATPPNSTVAAVYLTLDNRSHKPDRLLSLASPRATRVEVHAIVHEGNVAKMRRVGPLEIAARGRLLLEPGGTHIMLMGLASPLVAGERVPLVLRFAVAGDLTVAAVVLAAGDVDPAHHRH